MADREPASDPLSKAAEVAPHPLPDWFQRLEAGGPACGVDADTLSRAVIDGHEHRDLSLTSEGRGQVGAPHRVHRLRDDGAVVVARASGRADPRGREEAVLAHEPQHPAFRCAKARDAQPGPDLPVSLAVKGAGGQDGADCVDQGRIRHRPDRTRTPWQLGPGGEMAIDRGARGAPDAAHAGQAIGPAA